ncbi:MAG: prephenate dehydrogenase, partial [Candidatus Omnitrophica bacterium]|nr:prephenate dehydrogenase [Candidatus Omnitrophota bacterium]
MLFKKVSIIGVGLIGGSLGMAIRKKKIAARVIGIGRRRSSISKALKLGAIDEATLDLKKGLKGSDLVIISAPTGLVADKIKESVRHINKPAIIIDVASVKERIVARAEKIIRGRKGLCFIGTHPMAGSDETGVSMARPDLFDGAVCIITPTKYTNAAALNKIKKLWQAAGSKIKIMSTKEHDLSVSKVSHLPHLIAYALCSSCVGKDISLAGPG